MSVASTSEITAVSTKSFEDAIAKGIARSTKTVRNVKSAWVRDQEVIIEDGKITAYKVAMKVTFVLDD